MPFSKKDAGIFLSFAFLIFLCSGCMVKQTDPPGGDNNKPPVHYRDAGDHTFTIQFDGRERTYTLHVPPQTDADSPIPMIIVLHGATGNAQTMYEWDVIDLNGKADEWEFIAVYPDGTGDETIQSYYWNAAHCCGSAYAENVDDVGFIEFLILSLTSELNLDPGQIFVTGFSNGGMLAHRLGAELPDLIAAIAPLAGTIGGKSSSDANHTIIPDPGAPMPVIIFHGVQDQEVPYDGGHIVARDGREDMSVAETASFWAFYNHCSQPPVIENSPYGDYIKTSFTPDTGSGGAPVILYSMLNLGHVWPDTVGETTATDIILDFFFNR